MPREAGLVPCEDHRPVTCPGGSGSLCHALHCPLQVLHGDGGHLQPQRYGRKLMIWGVFLLLYSRRYGDVHNLLWQTPCQCAAMTQSCQGHRPPCSQVTVSAPTLLQGLSDQVKPPTSISKLELFSLEWGFSITASYFCHR